MSISNKHIKECWIKAAREDSNETWDSQEQFIERFAQLIVEECRTVVTKVYRLTALELCSPLLTADEEIAKHFYGVEL